MWSVGRRKNLMVQLWCDASTKGKSIRNINCSARYYKKILRKIESQGLAFCT